MSACLPMCQLLFANTYEFLIYDERQRQSSLCVYKTDICVLVLTRAAEEKTCKQKLSKIHMNNS